MNLIEGFLYCSDSRIDNVLKLIQEVLQMDRVPVKKLTEVSGTIISMERSHGEIVHLITRYELGDSRNAYVEHIFVFMQPTKD